jgi:hypothetical protein
MFTTYSGEGKCVQSEFGGNHLTRKCLLAGQNEKGLSFYLQPFSYVALLLAPFLLTGQNDPFNQMRENARWQVPIRPTLIWNSISDHILAWLPI